MKSGKAVAIFAHLGADQRPQHQARQEIAGAAGHDRRRSSGSSRRLRRRPNSRRGRRGERKADKAAETDQEEHPDRARIHVAGLDQLHAQPRDILRIALGVEFLRGPARPSRARRWYSSWAWRSRFARHLAGLDLEPPLHVAAARRALTTSGQPTARAARRSSSSATGISEVGLSDARNRDERVPCQNLKFDILNIMALPSISQATEPPSRYQVIGSSQTLDVELRHQHHDAGHQQAPARRSGCRPTCGLRSKSPAPCASACRVRGSRSDSPSRISRRLPPELVWIDTAVTNSGRSSWPTRSIEHGTAAPRPGRSHRSPRRRRRRTRCRSDRAFRAPPWRSPPAPDGRPSGCA